MAVQLRSSREISSNIIEYKEKTDKKEDKATVGDNGRRKTKKTTEIEKKMQTEQPEKVSEQKQKEKVQAYTPAVPFPQKASEGKE